jgi:hypothetical protein
MNWSDYFYYDTTSPSGLRWKVDRMTGRSYSRKVVSKGDVAGCLYIYWTVRCCGSTYQVSRIIYEMLIGKIPAEHDIDHIDGVTSNNAVSNLRAVMEELNLHNKRRMCNNSSGFNGVSWDNKQNGSGVKKLYAKAEWQTSSGKKKSKVFPVEKFGLLPAFKLACEYRELMICDLNTNGAGYTDRHGK